MTVQIISLIFGSGRTLVENIVDSVCCSKNS